MQRVYVLPAAPVRLERAQGVSRGSALFATSLATAVAFFAALLINLPSMWVLAGVAFAGVIFVEPRAGLYAALGSIGLEYVTFDPVTRPFSYLFVGVGSTTAIKGLAMSPVELLVACTVASWALRSWSSRSWRLPNRFLLGGALVFVILLLAAVEYGVAHGGDSTIAWWEVRALLAGLPVMLLTTGLVTERRHLLEFAAAILLTLLFLTGESFWRYFTYIRPGEFTGTVEFAFTHENGVLISLLLTLSVAWVLWGPNKLQRLAALVVAVVASMVLLTMRRRAGMLMAEAGLLTVGLVLLAKNWRVFLMVAPIVALGSALYLGAFWNNPNSLGQPARAFRSVFDEDSLNARDQASDDYRTRETTNVWWNIQAQPLRGIGFGKAYPKPLPFPELTQLWPFWPYISHNTMLWIWMKAGVVAFVSLWFLLGTAVTQIAHVIRRARDPTILTVATGALASIVMLSMFSYVDLGLVSPRLMILLGATIGLIPVLKRFVEEDEAKLSEQSAGAAT